MLTKYSIGKKIFLKNYGGPNYETEEYMVEGDNFEEVKKELATIVSDRIESFKPKTTKASPKPEESFTKSLLEDTDISVPIKE